MKCKTPGKYCKICNCAYCSKRRTALSRGNCYVTSEALYHLLGGKKAGYKPMTLKHEGVTHWYLDRGGQTLDLTASQFKTPPDYSKGRGRGFLTKKPSQRARQLMKTLVYKD